jgi:hypothetical protein
MPNEAALRRLARLVSKAERCLDATPIGHGAVRASASRAPSAPSPSRPTKWSTRCSSPVTAAIPGWTDFTSTCGASPCGSWSGPRSRKDAVQTGGRSRSRSPRWVRQLAGSLISTVSGPRSLGLSTGLRGSRLVSRRVPEREVANRIGHGSRGRSVGDGRRQSRGRPIVIAAVRPSLDR